MADGGHMGTNEILAISCTSKAITHPWLTAPLFTRENRSIPEANRQAGSGNRTNQMYPCDSLPSSWNRPQGIYRTRAFSLLEPAQAVPRTDIP
jgi:hypothetical protein